MCWSPSRDNLRISEIMNFRSWHFKTNHDAFDCHSCSQARMAYGTHKQADARILTQVYEDIKAPEKWIRNPVSPARALTTVSCPCVTSPISNDRSYLAWDSRKLLTVFSFLLRISPYHRTSPKLTFSFIDIPCAPWQPWRHCHSTD